MLLRTWKNSPCWNQGYCGCMPKRGFSIWMWAFLVHRYPTKNSANPGEKVVGLEEEDMLLIKPTKHTDCEKHHCGSSDHQHPQPTHSPTAPQPLVEVPSPSAWRRWRKEAIRASFPSWSLILSRMRKLQRGGQGQQVWAACHEGSRHIPQHPTAVAGWDRDWWVMFTAWSILTATVKNSCTVFKETWLSDGSR